MRMILTGIAALAVAGAALVAAAQPGDGRGKGRHGDGPNPAVLKQELGLSEERKQANRRRADMEIARMELEQALDAATVDEKVVAAKVQALTQLQAAALKARVDHRLAIGKLLTPEQREKMKQLKQEHRGRDRGRERGRHGRFGSGPAGQPVTPTGPAVLEQGER
jgi:Spy/CpxP family protein refolding chaperone